MMKKVAQFGKQPNVKKLAAQDAIQNVRVRCSNCTHFSEEKDSDYRWKYVSCTEGEFHMMRVNSRTLDTFKECDKFNAL